MSAPSRQRGQVLILLGAWLFFGGGASSALVAYEHPASELKTGVERVIVDVERRKAILSEVDYWEESQENKSKEVNESREDLMKIMRNQDAKRSDLEPFMATLDKSFVVMDWNLLHLRSRVKEQVTSAEWAEIVAPPKP